MPKDIYMTGPDGGTYRSHYVSPDPPELRKAKARLEAIRFDTITLTGVGPVHGPANERPILVIKSIGPNEGREMTTMTEENKQQVPSAQSGDVSAGQDTAARLERLEQMVAEMHRLVVQKQAGGNQQNSDDFSHELVLSRGGSGQDIYVEGQKGVFPLGAREELANLVVPLLKSSQRVKVSFTPADGKAAIEDPNKQISELKAVVVEVQKQVGSLAAKLNEALASAPPPAPPSIPSSRQADGTADGQQPTKQEPAKLSAEEKEKELADWLFPMHSATVS
jgi:hypothetical protein